MYKHDERTRPRALLAVVAVACLLSVAAACGGDDDDDVSTATTSGATETTAAREPEEADPYEGLVEAATGEGKVTLYSSQNPDHMQTFATAFEEKYPGIDVEAIRQLDGDMPAKIEAERSHGIADVYVTAAAPVIADFATKEFFVPASAPNFESDEFVDGDFMRDGNFFEVGSAVLVPAWNTNELPDGIDSYEDFLDPALAGRIGVPEPTASSFVDMYLYLEEHFGEDFVDQLAAQQARIYSSATATGQAIVPGEIAAALFVPAPIADKEAGAPIDFLVPEEPWGTVYYGAILESAPHPNAAQLLADFMVSREGQELVQRDGGALYPDIPGTLISNDKVRKQDFELLTPEFIGQYQERWRGLFQ